MILQIIEDEIFYKGEKVATLENDPRKSSVIEDFKWTITNGNRRY